MDRRRAGGRFTDAELAFIDQHLRLGTPVETIRAELGTPEATFYWRLKRTGKRVSSPVRCLEDIPASDTSDGDGGEDA